jgi:hypothetical protein
MDIDKLRAEIASGQKPLRITTHAQVEAAKDGLLLADLRFVFENGRVIEEYPEEERALLHAKTPTDGLPAHIVVENAKTEGVIVTAYIPDPSLWLGDRHRKRKKR